MNNQVYLFVTDYSLKVILGITTLERNIGTLKKSGFSNFIISGMKVKSKFIEHIKKKYDVQITSEIGEEKTGNYLFFNCSTLLTDKYIKEVTSQDKSFISMKNDIPITINSSIMNIHEISKNGFNKVNKEYYKEKLEFNEMIFINSKKTMKEAKFKVYYGLNKNTDIYEDKLTLIIRMIMLNTMLPVLFFLRFNPNLVSFCSLVSMLIAGALFSFGNYYVNLAAIVFMISGLAFDFSDGMVARFTNRPSRIGGWLEHTYDRLSINVLVLGITIGIFRNYGDYSWIWGMLLILTMNVIAVIEKSFKEVFNIDVNLIEYDFKKEKKNGYMFFMGLRKLAFRTFLFILIGIIFNIIYYIVIVFSIIYIVYIIIFILIIVFIRNKL